MKKIRLLFLLPLLVFLITGCGKVDSSSTDSVFQLDVPQIDCGDATNCKK